MSDHEDCRRYRDIVKMLDKKINLIANVCLDNNNCDEDFKTQIQNSNNFDDMLKEFNKKRPDGVSSSQIKSEMKNLSDNNLKNSKKILRYVSVAGNALKSLRRGDYESAEIYIKKIISGRLD